MTVTVDKIKLFIERAVNLSDKAEFLEGTSLYDIASGHAGYSLMFTQLFRILERYGCKYSDEMLERSYRHLLQASASWSQSEHKNIGLFDGIAGYIFSLSTFDKAIHNESGRAHRMALNLRKEIKDLILSDDFSATYIQPLNDVISGICGALSVCQLVAPSYSNEIPSSILKKYFINEDNIAHSYFFINQNFPSELLERQYPQGYIDFGVAHGITGMLSRLIKVYSGQTANFGNLSREVRQTINWVIDKSILTAQCGVWSTGIDSRNEETYTDYGWCYGQLSQVVNMQTSALELIKRENREKIRTLIDENIKLNTVKVVLKQFEHAQNFGLCHGVAGYLLLINYLLYNPYFGDSVKRFEVQDYIRQYILSINFDEEYHDLNSGDCAYSGLLNGGVGTLITQMTIAFPEISENKEDLNFLFYGAY